MQSLQPSYHDKRQTPNNSHVLETIVRNRIKDSIFYKQFLYLTNESTIIPVIINHVKFIGGLDTNNRPCPFLCCLLRLLEISPSQKVVSMYLSTPEFKYLTCLTLFYVRMISPKDTYRVLDNYMTNYTKLRLQLSTPSIVDGVAVNFKLTFIDEFVDELLESERYLGVILPLIEKRRKRREYHVTRLDESVDERDDDEEGEGLIDSVEFIGHVDNVDEFVSDSD